MNANNIITDEMTLEEKLAAIDAAMNDKNTQKKINTQLGRPIDTPIDPADALMCEGCQ